MISYLSERMYKKSATFLDITHGNAILEFLLDWDARFNTTGRKFKITIELVPTDEEIKAARDDADFDDNYA